MNRLGCFVLGISCGVVGMQIGHWLYLRSADYAEAAVITGLLSLLAVFGAHVIGEEWS
jgi:hypothetical protein